MKANIANIEPSTQSLPPPGKYRGTWGGDMVILLEGWRMTTDVAVRGIHIPCIVTVDEKGNATVDTNLNP